MALFFRVGDGNRGRSYVHYDCKGEPSHTLGSRTSKRKYEVSTPVGSYIPSSFTVTPSYIRKNAPYKTRTKDYPTREYYKTLRTSLPKLHYVRSQPSLTRNELIEYALPGRKYYREPPSWARNAPIEYHSSRWTDYSSSPSWTLLNRAYRGKYTEPIEFHSAPWTGRSMQFLATTFVSDKGDSPLLTYSKPLSATLKKYSDPLAYAVAITNTKSHLPALPSSQYLMPHPKPFGSLDNYAVKRNLVRRQPLHKYLKSLNDAEHMKNNDYLDYANLGRLHGKMLWTTRSRMYRFGGPPTRKSQF